MDPCAAAFSAAVNTAYSSTGHQLWPEAWAGSVQQDLATQHLPESVQGSAVVSDLYLDAHLNGEVESPWAAQSPSRFAEKCADFSLDATSSTLSTSCSEESEADAADSPSDLDSDSGASLLVVKNTFLTIELAEEEPRTLRRVTSAPALLDFLGQSEPEGNPLDASTTRSHSSGSLNQLGGGR
jgi:hypothetical protein